MLSQLLVVEPYFIIEGPTGIPYEVVFNDIRLFLLMRAAHEEQHA
jgi:hypothetical protein